MSESMCRLISIVGGLWMPLCFVVFSSFFCLVSIFLFYIFFFFFQAEDGIRDGRVTGVQTCALPILKLAESEKTNIQILKFLSDDPDARIRYAVAYNENATPALLEKLSRDSDWTVRYAVARNLNTPPEILARLTTTLEVEERVRSAALQNPSLPFDIWLDAYDSYDKGISSAARLNPKHAKRA